ncbi:DUF4226 domain-containing protein [Mycobacterium avium]|nr:DUF4226 domain-containing protein [Mycobacterium avium]
MAAVDIDAALRQLRAQLGSAEPPQWPSPTFGGPVIPPPDWTGVVNAAARARSDELDRQRQTIADAHRAVGPLTQSAAQIVASARTQLDAVIAQWQTDKAALSAVAATPAGKAAVLQAGSIRVSQANAIVAQAHTQFATLAGQVSSLTGQLPASTDGHVRAVDFTHGPLPLAPGPDPGYPVNDVIAEATDLDGNHVILRRGYYDARTREGFGWDKIYWKHGLINPNVFRDLISHARPKTSKGGTLEYEVPINKTHCTSGAFGLFPDCTDTGESLTMRIVVNTNPSSDVPGGGQKGVITMYPLPGGSGVVEVEPRWTLTPPWVNNYAPLN